MDSISRKIADLSPEKRRLLERILKREGIDLSKSVIVSRKRDEGQIPLSFAQQRLWFLDQLMPGSSIYTVPGSVWIRGALDVPVLKRCLDEIVRRHETLRTTFTSVNGQPAQVIADSLAFSLPVVDLTGLPETERETEAIRLAREEGGKPYDLSRGPLLRARLFRLERERHLLLFGIHHIVSDGWSMGVFFRELAALYEAFTKGKPTPLGELPIQYADFAIWQREYLQGDTLEEQLSYWKGHLENAPPAIELPHDSPRPPVQTYRGASYNLVLSEAVSDSVTAITQREGATLFMTLLAAFATLLSRYTGQEDIVIGSPIAGRTRAETDGLIGFFLNTLAMRIDCAGEPTFTELVRRVREVALGAYAHQDLPFEKLLEEMQPERDLSRTPLFQVFFNHLNFPERRIQLADLEVVPFTYPEITSNFDLTLYTVQQAGVIHLSFVFNADLFDHGQMAEMLRQMRLLLTHVVRNPDERITRYSLVTRASRDILPDPAAPLSDRWEGAVHDRFTRNARQRPDRPAVIDANGIVCYGELDELSTRLARLIRARGIERGDVVAVYAHRSASLVWALLAVLKAGAAFTILDPAYPAARLAVYLRGTGARGLLVCGEAGEPSDLLGGTGGSTGGHSAHAEREIRLCCRLTLPPAAGADARRLVADASPEDIDVTVGPETIACVTFTSGSTGEPKGVLCRHGPLSHFLPWQGGTFGLDEADRYSMLSGLSHDPLQRDILTPLWFGAVVCVPDPDSLAEPGRLVDWMRRERITVAHMTPAMAALVAEGAGDGGLSDLRHAFVVGDVLRTRDIERLRAIAPGAACVNLFGATETQRAVAYYVVPDGVLGGDDAGAMPEAGRESGAGNGRGSSPDEARGGVAGPGNRGDAGTGTVVPLGRGMADVQLLVLNRAGTLAGIGEVGEICVRSPHLARGYLDDPDLTARRFITNPFTGRVGDRLYRTGDVGRYRPDGTVAFGGRVDQQIKIRGFRIEPAEVEAALSAHPDVRRVCVSARRDGRGEKRLVAYFIPGRDRVPSVSALRAFLLERLPDFMVPNAYVSLDALPLTPNNKVDRDALPDVERGRPDIESSYAAPWTPTEDVLCGIWAHLIGVDRVGVYDNFFDLGGHSLLATQVIARIRDTLGVDLPLGVLFEEPTVAVMAKRIEAARRAAERLEAPPLVPAPRTDRLPLSFAQQRLWFLDQLLPGNPAYNIPAALELKGPLDADALRRAFEEILHRHETLRTTFHAVDGQPVQRVADPAPVEIPAVDLTGVPAEERERLAWELAAGEGMFKFDLARGPLLRIRLLRLHEEHHILIFNMHHIISDGWSMSVLIREMAALYGAYRAGEPSPLSELPIQYADYAYWQRNWLRGTVLGAQLAYWRETLGGRLPLLGLPTDRPRPVLQSFRGGRRTFALPDGLTASLRELRRREGCTLYMALLAAFKTLLYRYSGQTDILVGTPIANRTRIETEPLIGFFVNTLVMRTDLSGNPTFRELLARVREVALGAYAHQDLPFEKLVDEINPTRDLGHSPLFQVMFVIQNVPREPLRLPELEVSARKTQGGTSKFDLTLSVIDAEPHITGTLEFNSDIFRESTITRMIEQFRTLLEGVVKHPDARIDDLPLMQEHERRRIVGEWNETRFAYGGPAVVSELFTAQVKRTPDAVAVSDGENEVTYRTLDRVTDRLARRLRERGVGPEVRVGILLGRSIAMVAGIIAILKAGGAYVPLDPAYPADRIAFMLEDAGADLVLTEERMGDLLPARGIRTLCLDGAAGDGPHGAAMETAGGGLLPGVDPENLAYVMYTSGTTGQPKGVMIPHRALGNYCNWAIRYYHADRGGGTIVHSSLMFDLTVTEVFVPLLGGQRVRLAPEREHIGEMVDLLAGCRGLSLLKLTPAHLEYLDVELPDRDIEHCTAVLVVGGEQLYRRHIGRWLTRAPHVRIVNEYGPTETVVGCCVYEASADVEETVPIGRPIANARLYILDRRMEPVPVGAAGELYIGGAGVARGYMQRPSRTAECFVPDPFTDEPGRRIYRSGDIARYLPDGTIHYLGRRDSQVKIRGFRIELGEIEAVLASHPAVRETAVIYRDGDPGGNRLVAYIVPRDGESPPTDELRDYLASKLPEYMVPRLFVTIDELPIGSSGKVDAQALPAPDGTRPELAGVFAPPRTPIERRLAAIWSEVLGIDEVGIHDNFFDLGGDSIISIQIIARANRVGLRLAPKDIFQRQTVAGLAAVAGTAPAVTAEQGRVEGELPLTPVQRWFFEQDIPDPHHYNQTLMLEVRDGIDIAALGRVAGRLFEHHDALRLRFAREGKGWRQYHAPAETHDPVTAIDLSAASDSTLHTVLVAEAAKMQGTLDLSGGPVMRLVYFDCGPRRPGRLLFIVHHLAVDGVSRRILLEDFRTAYDQVTGGREVELPPKTTSFKYWAERLARHANASAIRGEFAYWTDPARGAGAHLPIDYPGGDNTHAHARTVSVTLGTDETRALLQEVPPVYRTQINDILLTALARTLERWTVTRVFLVDVEGHGREDLFDDVDISRTVGWFTTIFPVCLDLSGVAGAGEAITAVKEQLRAVPNRGIGYGLLRYLSEDAALRRGLSTLPRAQVSFNYLGRFDQGLSEGGRFVITGDRSGPAFSPRARRPHLIDITGVVVSDTLQVSWTYSECCWRGSTIEELAASYLGELRALIDHCRSPEAGGYTPSDFAEFDWDQDDLDAIADAIRESEE